MWKALCCVCLAGLVPASLRAMDGSGKKEPKDAAAPSTTQGQKRSKPDDDFEAPDRPLNRIPMH